LLLFLTITERQEQVEVQLYAFLAFTLDDIRDQIRFLASSLSLKVPVNFRIAGFFLLASEHIWVFRKPE